MKKNISIETLATHGSYSPDATGSTNAPIYLSTSYKFEDTEYAASLFALEKAGYIYSRLHNPTTTILEDTVNSLEGGVAAVASATGHFAEFMTIAALAKAGENIVSSSLLYGGTHNLFAHTLPNFGITVKFGNQKDLSSFEKLIDDKTKAVYIESIANPAGDIADFQKIADIAHKHGIPLIVDNTCATPYLFRPIEHGADIVLHSCTKYLGGHGAVMGGIVVDSGNFDWKKSGKFPALTEPDASYNGVVFTERFGNAALALKLRAGVMRDLGGTISPFNSYMINQGIGTLHVRMDRHVQNAQKLAEYLSEDKNVGWVNYPGLKNNPNYEAAKKYMPKGAGAILTFGVKGGFEKGKKVIGKLTLPLHLANLGDIKTLVIHPSSTTHAQLNKEEQLAAGISDDLIRVSVGIENIDDIISDFEQALKD
ncbi:MAG: O-acetylhomoserine aminocarboxypropyltransferase/cysteine synthase [Mucispirillum sp.]|nr:O-acetylhomoserine aminocarboxypropyltransferase/cysteine synthase [Mucispirillum sp.]